MVFAANDVRNLHLDVVNHVDEMKNPGAVRAANGHVGMRPGICQIEIDFAANHIIDNDMLARRAKAERARVLKEMTGVLQLFQIALVKFGSLALKVGTEVSSDVGTFVPIQLKPLQPFINRSRRFFRIARFVGVLDPQNEFATVMACEEPIEEGGTRATNMKITGG